MGELLARQVEGRGGSDEDPLFSFDGRRCVHPGSASQTFHRLVAELDFPDLVRGPGPGPGGAGVPMSQTHVGRKNVDPTTYD